LSILSSIHLAVFVVGYWLLLANAIVATQIIEYVFYSPKKSQSPSSYRTPYLLHYLLPCSSSYFRTNKQRWISHFTSPHYNYWSLDIRSHTLHLTRYQSTMDKYIHVRRQCLCKDIVRSDVNMACFVRFLPSPS